MTEAQKMRVQHWRGFPGKNGWKSAPMLELDI